MDPILFFFSFKLTLENKKFKEIEEMENSGFFFFAIEKDFSAHNLYYLFDSLVHT